MNELEWEKTSKCRKAIIIKKTTYIQILEKESNLQKNSHKKCIKHKENKS